MAYSAGLTAETVEYVKNTEPAQRKKLGQYFTPAPIREALVKHLGLQPGMRVLDPGVGTGEFLLTCEESCGGLELYGWDVDAGALGVARRLVPGARIELRDALAEHANEQFDVIVGNPPYFEVRKRPELRERFARVIGGRPNIFAMFFHAGLSLLKPGGRLGFVVPPSMNNGAYFERLRRFVVERAEIEYLQILGDAKLFIEAQQAVQLIVLRKGGGSDRYQFKREACEPDLFGERYRLIFSPEPGRLHNYFEGRKTVFELGYHAVTGTVVWNQHRARLRREAEDGAVPLLWAHNIISGRVDLDLNKRPQYVLNKTPISGPAIVVNRITGSVGGGALRAAFVEPGFRFIGENHVNVILARERAKQAVSWQRLHDALRDPAVTERVRTLTGNTQISATELTHLVPLDG